MKVAIIGAGRVGTAASFALALRNVAEEVYLLDIDKQRVTANVLDINHGSFFFSPTTLHSGRYEDLAQCDVVVLTAGFPQKDARQSRLELVQKNVDIVKSILEQAAPYLRKDTILITVSNPVDILNMVVSKILGRSGRIFGSGTILDSSRFRYELGKKLNISPNSIHAVVVGEHGDSGFSSWSTVHIGSVPLESFLTQQSIRLSQEEKEEIETAVRLSAYRIIEGKGCTDYGVGGAIARLCRAIAYNEQVFVPVSTFHTCFGLEDVSLSLPTLVDKRGVVLSAAPPLDEREERQLRASADVIRETFRAVRF